MRCGDLGGGLGLEISLGSGREVLLLDLSRRRASTVLVDSLLRLAGVLLGKSLNGLCRTGSLLASKVPDLGSLLAGERPALLKLGINDLLVLNVDERTEVGNDSSDESEAPHGNKLGSASALQVEPYRRVAYLDENVGDQGSKECSDGNVNVLSKDNALGLDNEEVDELLNIVKQTLERRLRDSKVLAGPELGSETLSDCQLASDLCRGSGTEQDPSQLEDVADDVQVTGGEDEEDGGGEGNTGRAGVLPAQETIEHAVVVCEVLADLKRS